MAGLFLEPAVLGGLVQRIGQHTQLRTDVRDTRPLIKQSLRLDDKFWLEFMTPRRWWRGKEALRTQLS